MCHVSVSADCPPDLQGLALLRHGPLQLVVVEAQVVQQPPLVRAAQRRCNNTLLWTNNFTIFNNLFHTSFTLIKLDKTLATLPNIHNLTTHLCHLFITIIVH